MSAPNHRLHQPAAQRCLSSPILAWLQAGLADTYNLSAWEQRQESGASLSYTQKNKPELPETLPQNKKHLSPRVMWLFHVLVVLRTARSVL